MPSSLRSCWPYAARSPPGGRTGGCGASEAAATIIPRLGAEANPGRRRTTGGPRQRRRASQGDDRMGEEVDDDVDERGQAKGEGEAADARTREQVERLQGAKEVHHRRPGWCAGPASSADMFGRRTKCGAALDADALDTDDEGVGRGHQIAAIRPVTRAAAMSGGSFTPSRDGDHQIGVIYLSFII